MRAVVGVYILYVYNDFKEYKKSTLFILRERPFNWTTGDLTPQKILYVEFPDYSNVIRSGPKKSLTLREWVIVV